jgi:hypothetical protein
MKEREKGKMKDREIEIKKERERGYLVKAEEP